MSSSGFITAEQLSKNLSDSPSKNFIIDWENERSSKKSDNKYVDIYSYDGNGNKTKLIVAWKKEQLRGRIRGPEERKYAPEIQFRKSSGNLGEATCLVYEEFKRQIEDRINSKQLKVRGPKAIIRSKVQVDLEDGTLLDDPIIRFKLPFRNGKPIFDLIRFKNSKPVKVSCTEDNIHEILKSGTITCGTVNLGEIVFSGFGISIPATVESLVIKPKKNNKSDIVSLITAEEIEDMNDSDSEDEPNGNSEDEENEEHEEHEEHEEGELSIEDQLKKLNASVDDEDTSEAKPAKKPRGRKKKN